MDAYRRVNKSTKGAWPRWISKNTNQLKGIVFTELDEFVFTKNWYYPELVEQLKKCAFPLGDKTA